MTPKPTIVSCDNHRLGNALRIVEDFRAYCDWTNSDFAYVDFAQFRHIFQNGEERPFAQMPEPFDLDRRLKKYRLSASTVQAKVEKFHRQSCDRNPSEYVHIRKRRRSKVAIVSIVAPWERKLENFYRPSFDDDWFLEVLADSDIVLLKGAFLFGVDRAPDPVNRETFAQLMKPHARLIEEARKPVDRLRRRYDSVVAIHLRRSDYETWQDGRYFYSFEQYGKIMDRIRARGEGDGVGFLLCSEEEIPKGVFDDRTFETTDRTMEQDFAAMSLCDAVVGPPSTFATYATVVGGGVRHIVEDPERFEPDRIFSALRLR